MQHPGVVAIQVVRVLRKQMRFVVSTGLALTLAALVSCGSPSAPSGPAENQEPSNAAAAAPDRAPPRPDLQPVDAGDVYLGVNRSPGRGSPAMDRVGYLEIRNGCVLLVPDRGSPTLAAFPSGTGLARGADGTTFVVLGGLRPDSPASDMVPLKARLRFQGGDFSAANLASPPPGSCPKPSTYVDGFQPVGV